MIIEVWEGRNFSRWSLESACEQATHRHAVANEKNDVLGLALLRQRLDVPVGKSLTASVVLEAEDVLSGVVTESKESVWLVARTRRDAQSDMAIRLGEHVHKSRCVGVLREKILKVGEVVRVRCAERVSS